MSHATQTKLTQATRHVMKPGLDDFLIAIRDTNPFAANRITEPSPYDIDVSAIHAAGFDRLVNLSGQAMRQRSGIGVALLGSAGVGKSHLLSRLYRWANEPAEGEGGGRHACYVYVQNILSDPDRLPRYLLKYVVSRLSEGGQRPLHQTPLYRFVDRAIRHALEVANIKTDKIEDKFKESVDAYRSYFVKSSGFSAAYHGLFQFWRFARPEKANEPGRRDLSLSALGWLSGDEIDPAFASKLGFKADCHQPVMLGDDQEVRLVLIALTQLALVSNQPFILCIDQFENLDPDKFKPLVRFLQALLDHAANLLVISSGVKQTLLAYKEDNVIPEAAWDRIAEYKIELSRLKKQDARKILEARLDRFLDPFLEVDAVRRYVHEDTLFPLGRVWLEDQLGDAVEVRARDVLTWARDAWEERRAEIVRLGGEVWIKGWPGDAELPENGKLVKTPAEIEKVIDAAVDSKIEEQIAQHRLQPGSLPPDAGNLAGLVESLLGQCKGDGLPYTYRGIEQMQKKGGRLPPYDLLVRERREPDGHEVFTGVLFVTNVGLSATAALKRLLEDDKPPDHRLLVTDHERRPLKVGAQGVEYYKDLHNLGSEQFLHLKIDFGEYARLDALRDVVGLARSGDLEIEESKGTPRQVLETEVVASHHRKDRYRSHPLLRPLLTEEPPKPKPKPEPDMVVLDEKDVRQYIMAQLAWMMGSTAWALAKGYVEAMKGTKVTNEVAWPRIKEIAGRMHADKLVHATPQDDDLFLLLRK